MRTSPTALRGLVLAAAVLFGAPVRAQIAAGELTGVISDGGAAAVPGATVTVPDLRRNLPRATVSTREGLYTAAGLLPGTYRIDVELAGFKPVRREAVRVQTGE